VRRWHWQYNCLFRLFRVWIFSTLWSWGRVCWCYSLEKLLNSFRMDPYHCVRPTVGTGRFSNSEGWTSPKFKFVKVKVATGGVEAQWIGNGLDFAESVMIKVLISALIFEILEKTVWWEEILVE
jgi:hypothetical protein